MVEVMCWVGSEGVVPAQPGTASPPKTKGPWIDPRPLETALMGHVQGVGPVSGTVGSNRARAEARAGALGVQAGQPEAERVLAGMQGHGGTPHESGGPGRDPGKRCGALVPVWGQVGHWEGPGSTELRPSPMHIDGSQCPEALDGPSTSAVGPVGSQTSVVEHWSRAGVKPGPTRGRGPGRCLLGRGPRAGHRVEPGGGETGPAGFWGQCGMRRDEWDRSGLKFWIRGRGIVG